MHLSHQLATRALIAVAIPLAAVAIYTPANNAFEPAKLFVLIVVATGLLAGLVVSAIHTGVLVRPPLPLLIAAAVFTVGLVVATVTANDPVLALVGVRGRYGGLLAYLCVVLVILLASQVADVEVGRWALMATCIGLGIVTVIGLLQVVGVDPIARGSDIAVTSTFGNSNFAGAWAGAGLGAVAWLGVSSRGWDARRWTALVLGIAAFGFVLATRALQGLPTALAAVTPLALIAVSHLAPTPRRLVRGGLVAVATAGAATIVAGVMGTGPASFLATQLSVRLRGFYWDAAIQMASGSPLTGIGLDNYAGSYRIVRSPEAAHAVGLLTGSDAAHNVPLHLLAGGGALLLIGYLAVVGVTGFLLLRGLLRLDGERQLVLAGVSGLWLGYQVQSIVSIDVPALMTLHAVSAGLAIGLATDRERGLRLPWAPPEPTTQKGGKRRGQKRRRPAAVSAGRQRAGRIVAGVVVLVGLVVASQPVRADSALYRVPQAEAVDDTAGAIAAAEDASSIGWWDPVYTHRLGVVHQQRGDVDAAVAQYEIVDEWGLGQFDSALSAARALNSIGADAAMGWYDRVLELDPHHPELLIEVATFYAGNGRDQDALALVDRLLEEDPDNDDAADLRSDLTGA